jgi:hypothetical protein
LSADPDELNPRSSSASADKSVKLADNGKYVWDNVTKKIHPWVHLLFVIPEFDGLVCRSR